MRSRFLKGLPALGTSLLLSCFLIQGVEAASKAATRPAHKKAVAAAPATNSLPVSAARKAERVYYAEAQKALDKKQLARYHQLLPHLKNYPLLPYLEYQELGDRLMTLPKKEVDQFFAAYPDAYVSERMRHRWLRTLAIKELWSDYLRYYDASLTDPELACLNLRARLATGDKSALKDVTPLWNVGRPQSKSCDPVFDQWKAAGMLTPALMWSRHEKAVRADEISLATDLAKQMIPAQQKLALLYENVAQNPRLVLQPENFNTQVPEGRAALLMGLERFAQANAPEALKLWQTYYKRPGFSDEERSQMNYTIARQLLRQDEDAAAEQLVAATPSLSHPDLMEALIREALRQQDWAKSMRWIARLPAESKQSERWSYWQARLMEELSIPELNGKKPKDIYTEVASTRSFYGFLAADRLGQTYSLRDNPLPISKELMFKVESDPGIQRAREFYLLGDQGAATREWTYTTHHFPSTEQMVAAGHLADRWGWYRQAIQTMQDSDYMDDLAVRFPIPFHENVKAAARQTSIDPHFIFAITKQESAFNTDAKSPVGAMGLMQLMPTTAKYTARKAGLNYNQRDLLKADRNIALGSRYLNELLTGFSNNRILAAAAYNAGPSRVKQWLTKEGEKQMPYDVWIETIPYKETRLYVQNILSFALIYGYRTGTQQPFLTSQELAQQL